MSRFTTDFIRVFAIIVVVIIHGTYRGETSFSENHFYSDFAFLSVILNQLARFCVPVFVIISGYALAYKYSAKNAEKFALTAGNLKDFYLRRFVKIAWPYLFLSLLFMLLAGTYFVWRVELSFVDNAVFNLVKYYNKISHGNVIYHFYFFLIIMGCYVFFPVLIRLNHFSLLLFLFLVHVFFTTPGYILNELGIPRPVIASYSFIYWSFYFYLGIYTAFHFGQIREKLSKVHFIFVWGAVILFAIWVIFEYSWLSYQYPSPGFYNHFHRHSVLGYSISFWLLMIRYGDSIESWFKKRPNWGGLIQKMAAVSFAVYIYHVFVISFFIQWLLHWPLLLTGCVILTTFLLFIYVNKLPFPNWLRLSFGLPEK